MCTPSDGKSSATAQVPLRNVLKAVRDSTASVRARGKRNPEQNSARGNETFQRNATLHLLEHKDRLNFSKKSSRACDRHGLDCIHHVLKTGQKDALHSSHSVAGGDLAPASTGACSHGANKVNHLSTGCLQGLSLSGAAVGPHRCLEKCRGRKVERESTLHTRPCSPNCAGRCSPWNESSSCTRYWLSRSAVPALPIPATWSPTTWRRRRTREQRTPSSLVGHTSTPAAPVWR